MIITYFGREFFKIQYGATTIATNPISKDAKGGAPTKFGADIALISTNHPDYNGAEQVAHGETVPFVIDGPGDYEVKEIFIKGIASESVIDGKKFINTIYTLTVDSMSLCFLGALGNGNLSDDAKEAIDSPDILFLPIGGKSTLAPAEAYKLAVSFEPALIIPMDYDEASLKVFLKEAGEERVAPADKLTLKKKDLDSKEAEVAVLSF